LAATAGALLLCRRAVESCHGSFVSCSCRSASPEAGHEQNTPAANVQGPTSVGHGPVGPTSVGHRTNREGEQDVNREAYRVCHRGADCAADLARARRRRLGRPQDEPTPRAAAGSFRAAEHRLLRRARARGAGATARAGLRFQLGHDTHAAEVGAAVDALVVAGRRRGYRHSHAPARRTRRRGLRWRRGAALPQRHAQYRERGHLGACLRFRRAAVLPDAGRRDVRGRRARHATRPHALQWLAAGRSRNQSRRQPHGDRSRRAQGEGRQDRRARTSEAGRGRERIHLHGDGIHGSRLHQLPGRERTPAQRARRASGCGRTRLESLRSRRYRHARSGLGAGADGPGRERCAPLGGAARRVADHRELPAALGRGADGRGAEAAGLRRGSPAQAAGAGSLRIRLRQTHRAARALWQGLARLLQRQPGIPPQAHERRGHPAGVQGAPRLRPGAAAARDLRRGQGQRVFSRDRRHPRGTGVRVDGAGRAHPPRLPEDACRIS
jgi:hypothetical protein